MVGDRRRRKSLWDVDEEIRHISGMNERSSWAGKEHHFSHDSERYQEFSAPRSFAPSKSRYNAGHPYWDPAVGDSGDHESLFNKEIGGGSRYFQNMSPGFDGIDRHKFDNSHENLRDHSHSYVERRRSRSRSRSRTKGRSRSRSLSRGRKKEKEKSWNQSRSRSRSWGDDNVKDQFKSDNPRICRDFASGRCRKGSQCKLYHSSGMSHGDGVPSQDETTDSWKSKAEGAYISNIHNDGPGPDLETVADPGRGREERFQTRSHTIPCREFVKGTCRWGNACRFLHDFASGESFSQVPRHALSETENQYQSGNIAKPFCKFFAVGKCGRNNCRFSHENRDADYENRKSDSFSGHGLVDDNKISDLSGWMNDSFNQEKKPASLGGIIPTEPIICLQSQDGNKKEKMHGILQGSTFSVENWQQNANRGSFIQRQDDQVKEFPTTNHSVLLPWQNRNQDLENRLSQNSSRVQISGLLPVNAAHPFPNMLTSELGTQLANAPAVITGHEIGSVQRVENQASRNNSETDSSRIFGMVSFGVNSNVAKSSPVIVSYNPNTLVPNGNFIQQNYQMQKMQSTSSLDADAIPSMKIDFTESPKLEQLKEPAETEIKEEATEMKQPEGDGLGTVEESVSSKDDKSMRLFKNSLVDFVKDILKPTWKEGQMSREVHKTIVKKVIDKVTTTIQTDQVPKTRDKVDQYLKYSKTKISKLVQAYVGRSMKKDS